MSRQRGSVSSRHASSQPSLADHASSRGNVAFPNVMYRQDASPTGSVSSADNVSSPMRCRRVMHHEGAMCRHRICPDVMRRQQVMRQRVMRRHLICRCNVSPKVMCRQEAMCHQSLCRHKASSPWVSFIRNVSSHCVERRRSKLSYPICAVCLVLF